MRALSFSAPAAAELVDTDPPACTERHSIVAPVVVGLCGTDLELYTGTMPYFEQGVPAYPIRPGHEVAAVIVKSDKIGLSAGTPAVVDPVVGCGVCSACHTGRQTHCAQRFELGIRRGMAGGAAELVAR